MKQKYFESIISLRVNFPNNDDCNIYMDNYIDIKLSIKEILKQFGFEMFQNDDTADIYECYSKDNLEDLIIQRTKFVMKRLVNEDILEIIDYKIIAVLIDSRLNDEIFNLK